MNELETLGVLGAGTMGAGIAQTAAMHGHRVLLYDLAPQALKKAQIAMTGSLMRLAEKQGHAAGWVQEVMSRVTEVKELAAMSQASLVIEAIPESRQAKRQLLGKLCSRLHQDTLVASNTSTIPITDLAAATDRPDRFAGLHFFNPVPLMPLVELIAGQLTSAPTLQRLEEIALRLGKQVVRCKDRPGFIANRLLLPFLNQAVNLLDNGVATREDIDRAVHLGLAHPMGPLQLADLIGLDILLQALEAMYAELGEESLRPAQLLRRLVEAGSLGRKSGRGFYEY